MVTRKRFQSINPDLTDGLEMFMDSYSVEYVTEQAQLLMANTISRKRGTAQFLDNVLAVGVLLAIIGPERRAQVYANLRREP